MTTPIKQALDALAVAKECGGENDLPYYAGVYQLLEQVIKSVRAHDRKLIEDGIAPTGDDYNRVLRMLGLDVDLDGKSASLHGMEVRDHFGLSEDEVQKLVQLLNVPAGTPLNAVPITAVVVNLSQGFIGGDDLSNADATLDLQTGRLVLSDPSLGYPLLNLDGLCTIIDSTGKSHGVCKIDDSVPYYAVKEQIIEHVKKHGYWAIMNLAWLLNSDEDIPY